MQFPAPIYNISAVLWTAISFFQSSLVMFGGTHGTVRSLWDMGSHGTQCNHCFALTIRMDKSSNRWFHDCFPFQSSRCLPHSKQPSRSLHSNVRTILMKINIIMRIDLKHIFDIKLKGDKCKIKKNVSTSVSTNDLITVCILFFPEKIQGDMSADILNYIWQKVSVLDCFSLPK